MVRPILIAIDNTHELSKYTSQLRDVINAIVGFCRSNPYMVDNDVAFISFEGDCLYETSISKFAEGNISLNTNSDVTLDDGIKSILSYSKRFKDCPFCIIITCKTYNIIKPEITESYKKSYVSFVTVCLDSESLCPWVNTLTNNPRIFYSPLLQDKLCDMFAMPSYYTNDYRDPNYIATI